MNPNSPAPRTAEELAAKYVLALPLCFYAKSDGAYMHEESAKAVLLSFARDLLAPGLQGGVERAKYIPDNTPMTPFPKGTECDGATINYPPT